jgi:FkbM family methyltransferase
MKKKIKYALLSFVAFFLNMFKINPLFFAYKQIGILKYENNQVSGEAYMIETFLKKFLKKDAVTFDVGAHTGSYSLLLRKNYPDIQIFTFEPNPETFSILSQNVNQQDINIFQLALGGNDTKAQIYSYSNEKDSEHASLHKEVMTGLHHSKEVVTYDITVETLDTFCSRNKIERIDFLKIDTEGNEYEVLKGAKKFLSHNNVSIIQFEFNEMNVVSRVFLKDFYEILPGYKFYRLDTKKLIPLGEYSPMNEIFQFQNIIAIRKDIAQ